MATTNISVESDRKRGWGRKTQYIAMLMWLVRVSIGFAFIWLLFEKVQTVFETLILALLLLIYDSVRYGNSDFTKSSLEHRLSQNKQFLELIRKCSREWNYQDEADQNERAQVVADDEAKLKQLNILYALNSLFGLVVYAFIAIKVLSVVL
jgi:hypothetical protein